ncbi:MAG: hypothetical protein ACI30Y_07085, partial [Candidatus Limisoma sp.]
MAKIRHLSEVQQEIAFTEFDFYQRYAETFKTSELGRIKSLLPLRQMAISSDEKVHIGLFSSFHIACHTSHGDVVEQFL